MQANPLNVGAYITTVFALQRTAFGVGVGNLAATDGEVFQRTTKRPLHLSGKLVVQYKATLASGKSLTIVSTLKDSADGVTYAAQTTQTDVINGLDSGAVQKGTVEMDVNLVGAKDYIRPTIQGTLTASGSDTAEVSAVLILGGGETVIPATLETA